MNPDLAIRVATLEVTDARLTAVLDAGGPDRRLPLAEVAARLGRRPATVRKWLADPDLRRRYQVEKHMRRVAGRWSATSRDVESWARHLQSLGARG